MWLLNSGVLISSFLCFGSARAFLSRTFAFFFHLNRWFVNFEHFCVTVCRWELWSHVLLIPVHQSRVILPAVWIILLRWKKSTECDHCPRLTLLDHPPPPPLPSPTALTYSVMHNIKRTGSLFTTSWSYTVNHKVSETNNSSCLF